MVLNGRDLFERIMQDEYAVMIRTAKSVVKSASEAEDVVAMALETICKNPHKLDEVENLRAYLAKMVRNAAFKSFRQREKGPLLLDDDGWNKQESPDQPEDLVTRQEQLANIRHVLKKMSPGLRQAFELVRVNGLSARQAAQILNVQESTIYARLNRAKNLIRGYLEQEEEEML